MHRKIILSIFAVAALFGLNISGCNRNRTQTVANRQARRDNSRTVRPAEVLSASAYRPPQHVYARTIPAPAPAYSEPAMAYRQQGQYQQQYQQYAQPQQVAYHPQPQPVYQQPQPAYVQPAIMAPQMAMAQGYISPAPAPRPVQSGPQIQPLQYMPPASAPHPPTMYAHAPLPELEPMRPYRLPTPRDSTRPVAEIMVSEGTVMRHDAPSADRQEIRRALAPLSPAPVAYNAGDSWVASPTTAMYQVPGRW